MYYHFLNKSNILIDLRNKFKEKSAILYLIQNSLKTNKYNTNKTNKFSLAL